MRQAGSRRASAAAAGQYQPCATSPTSLCWSRKARQDRSTESDSATSAVSSEPSLARSPREVEEEARGSLGIASASKKREPEIGLFALEDTVDELVLTAAIGVPARLMRLRQGSQLRDRDGVVRLRLRDRLPDRRRGYERGPAHRPFQGWFRSLVHGAPGEEDQGEDRCGAAKRRSDRAEQSRPPAGGSAARLEHGRAKTG